LLSLATAGAFLPSWDHYTGLSTVTGRRISFDLGDAFKNPWQVTFGLVLAALALVMVPVLAIRMRDRVVGATAITGSLAVLTTQFTSAIVQIGQPVSPAVAGLNPTQAGQLGLQLHVTLNGWFTLDLLAAFLLFVVVTVVAHARPVTDHNSAGTWPSAPDARMPASVSGS
jgi:hypothetical protein